MEIDTDQNAVPAGAPGQDLPTIDVALVRRLVARQFPEWAELPVRPVAVGGWDNRTFHLGDRMTVRLPSAVGYAAQVAKEHRWLPVLAPQLPLPIPTPLAKGEPDADFPLPWSVYGWIDGETANRGRINDLTGFAEQVAAFLVALKKVDPTGGPGPGPHNFHRGGPPHFYDAETRRAIEELDDLVPAATVTEIWEVALRSSWDGPPVWFHGDVAHGNLLLQDGALAAVIDFGTSGVGDPACDLAIAWTMFSGESRAAFRAGLAVDPGTWARGQGWALWKALIVWAAARHTDPVRVAESRYVVDQILTEFQQSS